MFVFTKSAIEERRRSGQPVNRKPLRLPEHALSFLPLLSVPDSDPPVRQTAGLMTRPIPPSRIKDAPQKVVPSGRKPLKPLTLAGSRPVLGSSVVGLSQPRTTSQEAMKITSAEEPQGLKDVGGIGGSTADSTTEMGRVGQLERVLLTSPSSSEEDGSFDYRQYLKENRTRETPEDGPKETKRPSATKRKSSKVKRTASTTPCAEEEFGRWTCTGTVVGDGDNNGGLWRPTRASRKMAEISAAFLKLHRNVEPHDVEVINNMVILKTESRKKSLYPKNFVIWLRGDRIYDLEADRGTVDDFMQDCNIAHVNDFNRVEVRFRRAEQGLPPFPYAPGQVSCNVLVDTGSSVTPLEE